MNKSFRDRVRGSTTAEVKARMAGARPFENCSRINLQLKLECGALRPEIANLVRAELSRRPKPENSN
jgi:hypothetical protein